ncbi:MULTISPECIES: APC family permease [Nitrosomonas]|uniref:Amino acid permease n=1 Tax=Nitrosomonas europaea (strain ATCC 19718 / CIP 103999 / KCTC 2705 / NBRC 14298) TaxID=228410 RepID=Q82SC4_NITEU|nr:MULTISPECIES: APC family permease [Nitrosomonas]KXK46221.1 MAG: amino acid permease [Nitrosomonas europaea]MEB2332544.1 APC family permease [Nitrosomonas sp.]CAD86331.1 Amino acid permease [Nitrosomonas europaea ATCC 19718]SDW67973.1 amino acid/polyamine/organocation transporter, APC superfamily [Nitrosomonas europaea]SET25847.1 amino acid/polyamine/organocation transporter, APC superfamily [Nitrosomonas europaea]
MPVDEKKGPFSAINNRSAGEAEAGGEIIHETGQLRRSMSVWNCFTLGFSVVSPVVGLYAIFGVQNLVTGGGWIAALILSLFMQLMVATVYAELSSQFPIAGGAYKWSRHLIGPRTGQYAGAIYVSSTIAMLTTTAYTGGMWLSAVIVGGDIQGASAVLWGVVFLLICTTVNIVNQKVYKVINLLGVSAEVLGSICVALVLFFFFRIYPVSELFQHLGTGLAPTSLTAFLAALAIAGWAFIGFDSCSTIAEEAHNPERMIPRAIFLSLLAVGSVVLFNSSALTLSISHDTLVEASATSDPISPIITSTIGAWAAKPFLVIVMTAFLSCGSSVVNYVSRIVFSMAREGNLPAFFSQVTRKTQLPRNAIGGTVLMAGLGLLFGLNDGAVATIIAFGTGGLYAMFSMTTGVGLYARLMGRWNPALGAFRLGRWGLVINTVAFVWALFELINIGWPREYVAAPGAPWWQLWAVPLVLGTILALTTLHVQMGHKRRMKRALSGTVTDDLQK